MDEPLSPRDAAFVGSSLAFIAGFADASSFVGADGVFCAHVTGNFVVLAADLALHADAHEWLKLATFPIFVLSVLTATWISRATRAPLDSRAVRQLLALKAALLAVAALVGALSTRPALTRGVVVTLLVMAMAVQNSLHRLRPTLGVMTTVMTGNVTQWVTGIILPTAVGERSKHGALAMVIVFFAVGCVSGALGVAHFGFVVLVVPTVVALLTRSRIRGA
jgi:uncharacterized membrane protein YoaK (UPF0700 family)